MSNIDTQINNIYAQEAIEQAATLKGATDFAKRQDKLRERGILVRHFNTEALNNFLRITIGTDDEMDSFIEAMETLCA